MNIEENQVNEIFIVNNDKWKTTRKVVKEMINNV